MEKRVNLFMGHYGSGKTHVAVSFAVSLAKKKKPVSIYDLDIVNPYFRTVDAKNILDANGIELIVSPYAETNVDIPAMNAASYKMTDDKGRYAVVDVGGDDRGALALGRFRDKIMEEGDYDAFLVVNNFRIETRDISGVLGIKREIETSGKLPFTAIVNNANLGDETTIDDVLKGQRFCEELSEKTGLPIAFTAVKEDLTEELSKRVEKILPVSKIVYGAW